MNTNTQQIENLKGRGFEVNICHLRENDPHLHPYKDTPKERFLVGTKVELRHPELPFDLEAWSYCNPNDQFNKRLGTKIALSRAVKFISTGKKCSHTHVYPKQVDAADIKI
jgi:hypothetical protein